MSEPSNDEAARGARPRGLVITRRCGESVWVISEDGERVLVTVDEIRSSAVRLRFRGELEVQREENLLESTEAIEDAGRRS